MWLFYHFNFETINDVLNLKSSWILSYKKINSNKNEKESKMENLTHSFREANFVLHVIYKSQSKKNYEKEGIFCTVYFFRRKLFEHLCFSSIYNVLNTLSECTYEKNYFIHFAKPSVYP